MNASASRYSALLVVGSSWVSRIFSAGAQLAAVRILLNGLGTAQYAVFAVMLGLTNFFALADSGLGYSLQNYQSEARATGTSGDAKIYATSIYYCVLLPIFCIAIWLLGPWLASLIFSSTTVSDGISVVDCVRVAGILLVGSGIGATTYKLIYANQKGYWANLITAAAIALGLIAIYLLSKFPGQHGLLLYVIAYLGPQALLPVALLIWLGVAAKKRAGAVKITSELKKMFRRSSQFWLFSLFAAIVLQLDYVVMAHFLSSADIVVYNIATKVFSMALFVYTAVLAALWPSCAEAIATKNWQIVRQYLRNCIAMGITWMGIFTIVMLLSLSYIALELSGGKVTSIPKGLILALGVYNIVRVWTDAFAMVLMSMSNLRPVLLIVPIQAGLSVISQCILAPRFGYYGVVIGITASFLLTVAWFVPLKLSYLSTAQAR